MPFYQKQQEMIHGRTRQTLSSMCQRLVTYQIFRFESRYLYIFHCLYMYAVTTLTLLYSGMVMYVTTTVICWNINFVVYTYTKYLFKFLIHIHLCKWRKKICRYLKIIQIQKYKLKFSILYHNNKDDNENFMETKF